MKKVIIYSDGSCTLQENGKSGYGAVIMMDGKNIEIYGGYTHSTNNRMEIMGVLKALETLTEKCDVTVYSDSRYVVDTFEKNWIVKWFAKDFKGVKNPDLWKRLVQVMSHHKVKYFWVKSHNKGACPGNERADALAAIGASLPNKPRDKRK